MTPAQLNTWKKRLGLSQAQAATALGITRNTLRVYEQRKRPIPVYIWLACQMLELKHYAATLEK